MPEPQILATGRGWDFWRIGESVYFCKEGVFMTNSDTECMGYECSYEDWQKFRPIYNWARDVK